MGQLPLFIIGAIVVIAGIVVWRFLKKPVQNSETEYYYVDASGQEVPRNTRDYDQQERTRKVVREEPNPLCHYATFPLVGGLVIGLLMLAMSVIRLVPANNVGIPTSFGAIQSETGPGLHVTAPWVEIHNFTTRVQESQRLASDEGDKKTWDCVQTSANDGIDMCIDLTVRYGVVSDKAGSLFRTYGSFGAVQDKLVRREEEGALKLTYGRFSAEDAKGGEQLATIQQKAQAELIKRLQRYGLKVYSITVGQVSFNNPEDQKRIEQKLQSRQDLAKAKIDQDITLTHSETDRLAAKKQADTARIKAQGEADANRLLTASLSPEVLQKAFIEALMKANVIYLPNGNVTQLLPAPQGGGK